MYRKLTVGLALLAFAGSGAIAGSGGDDRIARLSYLEGHVSFQHAGEVDWNAASVNLALQAADRIYTGSDGRAEVQFDEGSVLRLAENTDVEILALRETLIQIRILVGLASLSSRGTVPFEVGTPAAVFTTTDDGAYRFDVTEKGDSDAIVRKGALSASNGKFSRQVESGEVIHVTPGEQSTNVLSRYEQRDAWDEWTDRRDADMTAYESRRYLPDDVNAGVNDLDRYGRWVDVESYGPAWAPYYADAEWAPYWNGRWCYRPFWGWTWVSYEPWGWLPYHYGRWHFAADFGWCWLPGASIGFHFWSPGLVRFCHGPDWVSWYPLGPGDYYDVNNFFYNGRYSHHLTNLRMQGKRGPDDLVNRHAPGAGRGMHLNEFVNGGGMGRGWNAGDRAGVLRREGGQMVTGALPIDPSNRSYAPNPDRTPVRPGRENGLPTFVRTEPAGDAARSGRFVRANPGAADSGNVGGRAFAGGRNQPSESNRSLRSDLSGSRTETPLPNRSRNPGGDVNQRTNSWNRLSTSRSESDPGGGGRISVIPSAGQSSSSSRTPGQPEGSGRTVTEPRTYRAPVQDRTIEPTNPRSRGSGAGNPTRPPESPRARSTTVRFFGDSGGGGAGTAAQSTQTAPRSYQAPVQSRGIGQTSPRSSGTGAANSSRLSATPSFDGAWSRGAFSSTPSVRRFESSGSSIGSGGFSRPASRSWGGAQAGSAARAPSFGGMSGPSRQSAGSAPRSSRGSSAPSGRPRR